MAQQEAKNTPECGRDNVTFVCILILRKAGFVAGNVNPPVDVKFTCWHTKATRALSVSTTHTCTDTFLPYAGLVSSCGTFCFCPWCYLEILTTPKVCRYVFVPVLLFFLPTISPRVSFRHNKTHKQNVRILHVKRVDNPCKYIGNPCL